MPSCYICGTWIPRGGGARADLVTGSSFSSRGSSRVYISRKTICRDCARIRRRNRRAFQILGLFILLVIFGIFIFSDNGESDDYQSPDLSLNEEENFPRESYGDPHSDDSQQWYEVVIEDSDPEYVRENLCRDAFCRQLNGKQVVQITSFLDSDRAQFFAEEVNGQVVFP